MSEVGGLENEFVMVVGNADTKRKCVFQVVQDKLNMGLLKIFNEAIPKIEYRLDQAGGNILFCVLQTMGELMIDFHASPYAVDVDSSDETILRLAKTGGLFGVNLALDGSCGIEIKYLGPFTEGDPGFVSEEVKNKLAILEQGLKQLFGSRPDKLKLH